MPAGIQDRSRAQAVLVPAPAARKPRDRSASAPGSDEVSFFQFLWAQFLRDALGHPGTETHKIPSFDFDSKRGHEGQTLARSRRAPMHGAGTREV